MSRLLIVDDEERTETLSKNTAQFEGFETVEAVDGLRRWRSAGRKAST